VQAAPVFSNYLSLTSSLAYSASFDSPSPSSFLDLDKADTSARLTSAFRPAANFASSVTSSAISGASLGSGAKTGATGGSNSGGGGSSSQTRVLSARLPDDPRSWTREDLCAALSPQRPSLSVTLAVSTCESTLPTKLVHLCVELEHSLRAVQLDLFDLQHESSQLVRHMKQAQVQEKSHSHVPQSSQVQPGGLFDTTDPVDLASSSRSYVRPSSQALTAASAAAFELLAEPQLPVFMRQGGPAPNSNSNSHPFDAPASWQEAPPELHSLHVALYDI
jgi:hypothetical protein